MNRSYKQDNQMGLHAEKEILPILEKYFGEKIVASQYKYEKYDGASQTAVYEIKSRSNTSNAFPDTLIGANKVIPNCSKIQRFIFNFTDGIYYIEYDEELFNTFENSPFVRDPRIDYTDEVRSYYYIPVKKLTLIEKKAAKSNSIYNQFTKGVCLIKI
jgi:hypothetical protein